MRKEVGAASCMTIEKRYSRERCASDSRLSAVTTVAKSAPFTPLTPCFKGVGFRFGALATVKIDKGTVRAPEIGRIWFNSSPLSMRQLRGRAVLIDFWDYTCINCIRTLPYLKKWHERYEDKG